MKTFYTLSIIILVSIGSNLSANCHYRGGYISFEQIGDLKFDIRITTYTFVNSSIDRDSLQLNYGDGTIERIPRTLVQVIGDNIQLNIYNAIHTFPGMGNYQLFMMDSLKCGDNFSNNTNTPFCLYNDLKVLDPFFGGYNNSPAFASTPIDTACTDKVFQYDPNTLDPDNDSLVYYLSVPSCVQNYSFPNIIGSGNNTFVINTNNGLITWNNPVLTGDYAVSFVIREYRNGLLISESNFEFTIPVTACAVSTKDLKNDLSQQIEVFPNPTSGFINLNLNFEKNKNTQVQILNSIGELIKVQNLGEVMNYQKQLDFSHYPKGLYFVKITANSSHVTKRIIVN